MLGHFNGYDREILDEFEFRTNLIPEMATKQGGELSQSIKTEAFLLNNVGEGTV